MQTPNGEFTKEELSLIHSADSIMRVLVVTDPADNQTLRAKSTDLSASALLSEDYSRLCELMLATVTHPSQDGVGIAAPQVGLNRRVVAVMRFDKPGEPFEVYANIKITRRSESKAIGGEGCLSVPDMHGDVERSEEVEIEYVDMEQLRKGNFIMKKETINGFTAVIFQHEVDHLEGIIYTDRIETK
jgi:peptide deformylase